MSALRTDRFPLFEPAGEVGDTALVERALSQDLAAFEQLVQHSGDAVVHGDVEAGPDLWRTRLEAAIRFRDSLEVNATAVRLVHGEADLLPQRGEHPADHRVRVAGHALEHWRQHRHRREVQHSEDHDQAEDDDVVLVEHQPRGEEG